MTTPRSILLFSLLASAVLACRASVGDKNETGDDTDGGSETGDDSGSGPATGEFEWSLSLCENAPTVVAVDWSLEGGTITAARVEFGLDDTYGRVTTADLEGEAPWRTLLVGLKPETETHVRIYAETPEGKLWSGDRSITTGPVPAILPNLEVERLGDSWEGFLVTGIVGVPPAPVLLDADGEVVWWHMAEDPSHGGEPSSGGIVLGRTQLSSHPPSILYTYNNVQGQEDNSLYRVGFDGEDIEEIPAPYAHHDFVELPDGTLAYLAYDPQVVGREQVLGDRVMERAPDGSTREVWNVWDHFEYTASGPPERGMSWPHGNAIDYLPDEDAYLVGFLTLGSILKIDRSSGEILWVLGGDESDFTVDGSTEIFEHQHQFEQLDDSLLVFVNGGMDPRAESRVVELAFEPGTRAVEELWSYWPDPSVTSTNLGDVHRFASGNALVTFSNAGVIHEVDATGALVWSLTADIGGALSYVAWKEDLDVGALD